MMDNSAVSVRRDLWLPPRLFLTSIPIPVLSRSITDWVETSAAAGRTLEYAPPSHRSRAMQRPGKEHEHGRRYQQIHMAGAGTASVARQANLARGWSGQSLRPRQVHL